MGHIIALNLHPAPKPRPSPNPSPDANADCILGVVIFAVPTARQNYRLKLKNDDYKNQDPDAALKVCHVLVCIASVVDSLSPFAVLFWNLLSSVVVVVVYIIIVIIVVFNVISYYYH